MPEADMRMKTLFHRTAAPVPCNSPDALFLNRQIFRHHYLKSVSKTFSLARQRGSPLSQPE